MYKQEILLFGLAQWVLEKWRQANEMSLKLQETYQQVGLGDAVALVRDSVETVGYVSSFPRLYTAF